MWLNKITGWKALIKSKNEKTETQKSRSHKSRTWFQWALLCVQRLSTTLTAVTLNCQPVTVEAKLLKSRNHLIRTSSDDVIRDALNMSWMPKAEVNLLPRYTRHYPWDQWITFGPWLTARDVFYSARAHTDMHNYSFTNGTYLYSAWWTLFYSILFYSIKKKKSGHDPLNWFSDPLNWFLDPLMCHDRQFGKHWPDPLQHPLPPQGLGKREANVEKSETRDWDERKEEGGRDARNRLKERWEWQETKEQGMRNGRQREKRPTLDRQVYVILAIFLQESSLPPVMARAIIMLSACLKIFLSVGTISNYYGGSQREFSVCCPGIWAPERS